MTELTWIQIGDLQIGRDSIHRNNFLQDLSLYIQSENLHPEFIFVTGDITATGQTKEYSEASNFFLNLLKITNLDNQRIFIVPGNHDWNRKENTIHGVTENILALENYNHFISSDFDKSGFTFEKNFLTNSKRFSYKKLNIEVTGINSSWLDQSLGLMANREEVTGKILKQLQRRKSIYDGLKIVLMHHPLDDFPKNNGELLRQYLERNKHFILNSHEHKDQSQEIKPTTNAIYINFASESTLEEHPSTYGIVHIDFPSGKGDSFSRRIDSNNGKWVSHSQIGFFKCPDLNYPNEIMKKTVSQEYSQRTEEPETSQEFSPLLVSSYSNDSFIGEDKLGISDEVFAFASLFMAKRVTPPLCLGLFGDWGSGKSFFINKLKDMTSLLANKSTQVVQEKQKSDFCSKVVNIEFNAWHYSDSNLWASLTCKIYQELDNFIDQEYIEKRSNLFSELEIAKQIKEDAESRKSLIEQEQQILLRDLEENKNQTDEVVNKKSIIEKVVNAARTLFVVISNDNCTNLEEVISSAKKIPNIILILVKRFISSPNNLALLLLIGMVFLSSYLISIVLNKLNENLSNYLSILIQYTPTFLTIISLICDAIKKIIDAVKTLERYSAPFSSIVNESSLALNEKENELKQKLDELNTEKERIIYNIADAKKKIAKTSALIERVGKTDSSKPLIDYIHEQTCNESYLDQLGIISIMRQSFESLSKKMDIDLSTNEPSLLGKTPIIERVILYIDDLDRCNEEKVIEILQAVHLLLAFKLFIVVVSVDSRWLLHSLEVGYPALNKDSSFQQVWSDEELLLWKATPQNYLEKIIQIPYNLKNMDKTGFKKLIDGEIIGKDLLREAGNVLFTNPSPETNIGDLEPNQSAHQNTQNLTIPEIEDEELATGETEDPKTQTLNAEFLELDTKEVNFCYSLYGFLPTPRSVKRFINIYRLIKAMLKQDELENLLLSSNNQAGTYSVVMTLLAILVGFPDLSFPVFEKCIKSTDSAWDSYLTNLKVTDFYDLKTTKNLTSKDYCNSLNQNLERLKSLLLELVNKENIYIDIGEYKKWIPIVSRFTIRGLNIKS